MKLRADLVNLSSHHQPRHLGYHRPSRRTSDCGLHADSWCYASHTVAQSTEEVLAAIGNSDRMQRLSLWQGGPSTAPLGTWHSMSSFTRFFFILYPWPPQEHGCYICVFVGSCCPFGPRGSKPPRPPHSSHFCTPTLLSITSRLSRSLRTEPLYIFSRVTFSECSALLPCFASEPRPPPPPPNICEKMSPPPPPPSPFSTPYFPYLLYSSRLTPRRPKSRARRRCRYQRPMVS